MDKIFLNQLITSTLQDINLYSTEAVQLLLGTCAQESAFGTYRRQLGGGPALGIFQMEPFTHDDCWASFLNFNSDLSHRILSVSGLSCPNSQSLVDNDKYAICMARVKYYRDSQPIPLDLAGQAMYWKRVYNSFFGAGKVEEYLMNYQKYVA